MDTFNEALAFGQMGEGKIAGWLRFIKGWMVLPVYEKEIDNNKGPRLFLPDGTLVAPDMLVLKEQKTIWVEAKRKTVFSWHRKTRRWVTGIDYHHYKQYMRIKKRTGWDVWLLFLHESETPWDNDLKMGAPPECPVGLFGCPVETRPNHSAPPKRSGNGWGSTGMVYWAHGQLRKLAKLREIEAAQQKVFEAGRTVGERTAEYKELPY